MIEIEVNQGGNKVNNVYVSQNDFGIVSILINYQKRWCEYTEGSGSIVEDDGDRRYQSFYIYDQDNDVVTGEPFTRFGNITEVNVFHDGEFDDKVRMIEQCKDQLWILYIPHEAINDDHIIAEWEDPEYTEYINGNL